MTSVKSFARATAALALLGSFLWASPADAQRQSAIQCTSDRSGVLINKPVGNDTWVVTWRVRDGYTTGNVLGGDGSVTFLSCEADGVENGQVILSCGVSGACSSSECPQYTSTGDPVAIPCSFFSAPCSPIPLQPGGSNSRTCAGSPPRYPFDSEASCADFASQGGCASYTYSTNSCVVANCCTPQDCPD